MAKTFNYGAGIWATKTGSSMAYNDQNNNYKPTPFSVTRDSIATRVNKQGLIEVVGKDKLRIDYTDSTKGVALLEPTRTNLITYSEQLSNWSNIQNVTVTDDVAISPDGGQNASRINETTSSSVHRLFLGPTVSSAKHTYSVFLKKGTRSWAYLRLDGAQSDQRTWFDLENGVLGTVNADHIASIENFGNGWYRCTVSIAGTTYDTTPLAILALATDNNASSYTGSTDEYIYAWGGQLEAGSYATSYIPTSGSTYQRQSDVANGAGNSEVFNDSEGVLFADIAALANDLTYRVFGLSDGSTSNRIIFYYNPSSNNIELFISSGGASQATLSLTLSDIKLYQKVAVKYKSNDIGLWINGFEVGTDTSATMPSGLNELAFDNSTGTQNFYGKAKEIGVYDAVLTDAELEALTSYTSFTNMANELNLTIK